MKGDLLLLGSVGVAMVAVPAAVLLWSGQPLPGVVANCDRLRVGLYE